MKVRHFAGYGTVDATMIDDDTCDLHIKVKGNHEWGLIRRDTYDIYNWLVSKFDKSHIIKSYNDFKMSISSELENGVDVAHYKIYKEN